MDLADMKRRLREIREEHAVSRGTPMSPEEYKSTINRIAFMVRFVLDVDTERLLLMIDRAETLAPFLDPTLYQRFLFDDKAQADLTALKEMARCVGELQKIAGRLVDAMATT